MRRGFGAYSGMESYMFPRLNARETGHKFRLFEGRDKRGLPERQRCGEGEKADENRVENRATDWRADSLHQSGGSKPEVDGRPTNQDRAPDCRIALLEQIRNQLET